MSKTSDNDKRRFPEDPLLLSSITLPSYNWKWYFFLLHTNITPMHEYRRIALEKLHLCWLLHMLYVNIHYSSMGFYIYN